MPIIGSTQFLERIQFFNGERLFASDLQALETFNREMRQLHNQSLHQAGVGSGFQVLGNVGDRQVTVAPGYAIDSCGREIILTENQVLPIPPVADNGSGGSVFYDLTVSYPDDTDLKPSETRAGICLPTGVIRLREEPVFCWVKLSDDPTNRQPVDTRLKTRINSGLFLVLAQVEIFNCQLKQPVSTVPRRNARPAKQPRVACGAFAPAVKDWDVQALGGASLPVTVTLSASSPPLTFPSVRMVAMVDTRSGQFQATPSYMVRLSGQRVPPDNSGNTWILDGLVDVAQSPAPTPQAFWVEMLPVIGLIIAGATEQITIDGNLFKGWQIEWLGVES